MKFIFLLDTSYFSDVNVLNNEFRETFKRIVDVSQDYEDEMEIAVIQYDNTIFPKEPSFSPLKDYSITDCSAFGCARLALALKTMEEHLICSLDEEEPLVIYLFSPGNPTDNWLDALNSLDGYKAFNSAMKIAVMLGKEIDKDVLVTFVGDKEHVILPSDHEKASKLLSSALSAYCTRKKDEEEIEDESVTSQSIAEIQPESESSSFSEVAEGEKMYEAQIKVNGQTKKKEEPSITF